MEHNTQTSDSEESSLRQIGQSIQGELESVRSTAKSFEEQLEAFVRDRPMSAVFSALGLGFVVARIFSRR
jgi:ElaB/YqjD/DUF883 family membrane-anchored ribosome-binding protein